MHLLAETGYHEVITPTRNEVGRGEELLDKIYGLKNRSYRSLPYQILTVQNSTLEQPVHISGKQLHNISELDAKAYLVDDNGRSVLKQIMTNLIRINAALQLKVYAQVHASDLDLEILGIVSETLRAKDVSQTQIIDATTPDHTIRINFIAKDSLDREWDIIQVELTTQGPVFVEETGEHVASLTIHTHTVLENLLAFYLEDQEGGLPYWASPVQVAIVPISEAQEIYSEHIKETLANKGLRILVDNRSETMQARIRDAEVAKIPIIVIIGEKEETSRAVSVRLRNKQELGLVSEDSLEETLQSYVTSFSIS
jgi:threonyl-tRNA synthetase